VRFAETVAGRLLANPERGAVNAISESWTEFHDPSAAQPRQNSVVEGRALGVICALDRQVIERGGGLPDGTDSSDGIEQQHDRAAACPAT
jgi:hypothetical protein